MNRGMSSSDLEEEDGRKLKRTCNRIIAESFCRGRRSAFERLHRPPEYHRRLRIIHQSTNCRSRESTQPSYETKYRPPQRSCSQQMDRDSPGSLSSRQA